jgi:hypothetical protein
MPIDIHHPINDQDEDGNTALHRAVIRTSLKAVREILEWTDVSLRVRNNNGDIPLFIAVTVTDKKDAETICRLLLKDGVGIRFCDDIGFHPLHTTASAGCAWATKMLLDKESELWPDKLPVVLMDNYDRITALSLALDRYMNNIMAQDKYTKSGDPNDIHFDVDPSTVRLLMDATISAYEIHKMFWIDYPPTDPIFFFFSNHLPDCVRKKIANDGLDQYYMKQNRVCKSQYRFHGCSLQGCF